MSLVSGFLNQLPTGMINQGRIEAIEPLADIIRDSLKTYRINVKDCAYTFQVVKLL